MKIKGLSMEKLQTRSRTGIQTAKGKIMDIIVTAGVAIISAIIAVLIALITRKKIKKVFIYGLSGLIIGLPVGYLLAPVIISFI